MRSRKARLGAATFAFVIGATIATGVSFGSIPDGTSATITGCYPKSGGTRGVMRVIDAQKGATCAVDEAKITWPGRALTWQGQWKASTAYLPNDVVGYQGAAYVSVKPNAKVVPTVTGTWSLLAPAGVNGAPGATQHCLAYPHEGSDFTLPGSTPGHGCNLTGADLRGFDVRGTNFTNANLERVNMTDALLFNANFTGATITGVIWSHTECPDGRPSDANGTSPQSCVGHLTNDGPDGGPGD